MIINGVKYEWGNVVIELDPSWELDRLLKLYAPHSFKVLYPKRKYTKK